MRQVKHFNRLTPAQAERLAFLAEECGECIQAIGKILRHGYESHAPTVFCSPSNRKTLEIEIGDVSAAITLLVNASDVDIRALHKRELKKRVSVLERMHHQ